MNIIKKSLESNIKAAEKSKLYKENMSLPIIRIKNTNNSLKRNAGETLDLPETVNDKKYTDEVIRLYKNSININIEDICNDIEQDARRYPHYLDDSSKVVII